MSVPETPHSGNGLSSTLKSQDGKKIQTRKNRQKRKQYVRNYKQKIVNKYTAQNMTNGGGRISQQNKKTQIAIKSQDSEKSVRIDNEEGTDSDSESNSSQDFSTTTDDTLSSECDDPPDTNTWQKNFTMEDSSDPLSSQDSSPVSASGSPAPQETQLTSPLKDAANSVMTAKESDCSKATVAAKRPMAANFTSDESCGPKKAKTHKADAVISEPEDYQKCVELDTVGAENLMINSKKPHELMITAEILANCGDKEARKALTQALKCLLNYSQVTPEIFYKHAEDCKTYKKYFRACMFHMFSAYEHVAEAIYPNDLSTRIFDVGMLVKAMLKERKRNPDFSPGVYWKDIARLAVSFMPRMYQKGFGKDEVTQARDKAYALSWIAIAYRDIKQHKQAAKHAEKGIKMMNLEFKTVAERHAMQTYARLLSTLGAGLAEQRGKEVDGQKLLLEAVDAHGVADYESEERRQVAIEFTKKDLKKVETKIRAKEQRHKKD